MTRKSVLLPLLLLITTLPMCGGGSGDGVTSSTSAGETSQSTSTLHVNLTDKPSEEYLAVKVTVVSVRVHQSSAAGEAASGWSELPVTAVMPVDLLTLRNGVLYELCQAQLPVGQYQQIRLELAPNTGTEPPYSQSVVTADGVTHALDVPSGTIKIVHGFSVDSLQVTDLTLDFDASQSVVKKGNDTYSLKPVITAD